MQFLWAWIEGSGFMPHAHCYLWRPELMALHGVSDAVIGLSYFTIPVTMAWVVSQRKDVPYRGLFWAFVLFILSCGVGHLLEVATLWQPIYWVSGASKGVTALVSVGTAIVLARAAPAAVHAPTAEELRRAEDRFRAFADGSRDGFFLMDRGSDRVFRAAYANRRGVELVGRDQLADVLGQSLSVLLLGREDDAIEGLAHRAHDVGHVVFEEVDLSLVDGRSVTYQFQVVPIAEGIAITLRDVTQSRRDAAELRQLAEIVRSTQDAVLTADAAGRVTSWNPGAVELLGYSQQEARSLDLLHTIVPEQDRDQTAHAVQQALLGKELSPRETVRLHREGRRIPVSVQLSPLRDDRGEIIGVCAIIRDLSTSQQARRLREALHEREVLMREIHHRVKNDLQLVTSLLRRARRALPTEHRPPMNGAIERVRTIAKVHDLLYLSGRLDEVELDVYVRTITEELQQLAPAGIEVRMELAPVRVSASTAIAAGLVAHELLVNAFEHAFPEEGAEGFVEIVLHTEHDGERVVLAAVDDGGPVEIASEDELVLIRALAEQIGGAVLLHAGSPKRIGVIFPRLGAETSP